MPPAIVEIWGLGKVEGLFQISPASPLAAALLHFPVCPLQLWGAYNGCLLVLASKGLEEFEEIHGRKCLASVQRFRAIHYNPTWNLGWFFFFNTWTPVRLADQASRFSRVLYLRGSLHVLAPYSLWSACPWQGSHGAGLIPCVILRTYLSFPGRISSNGRFLPLASSKYSHSLFWCQDIFSIACSHACK